MCRRVWVWITKTSIIFKAKLAMLKVAEPGEPLCSSGSTFLQVHTRVISQQLLCASPVLCLPPLPESCQIYEYRQFTQIKDRNGPCVGLNSSQIVSYLYEEIKIKQLPIRLLYFQIFLLKALLNLKLYSNLHGQQEQSDIMQRLIRFRAVNNTIVLCIFFQNDYPKGNLMGKSDNCGSWNNCLRLLENVRFLKRKIRSGNFRKTKGK